MNKKYNLYNLEASFLRFLTAGNKNSRTIRSYLSDIRHFFGWISFTLSSKIDNIPLEKQTREDILQNLNYELIESYKNYLIESNIPARTINRRLSTLRALCTFCIEQGWIKENPAKKVLNVQSKNLKTGQNSNTLASLLPEFEKDMIVKIGIFQTKQLIADIKYILSEL